MTNYDKPEWLPEFCCKDFEYNHNRGIFFYYQLHEELRGIDIEDGNGFTVLEGCRFCPSCGKSLPVFKEVEP